MADPNDPLDLAHDARLVEWCMAGDPRAWEALVRRHERLVYAIARRYGLAQPDLEDVFQDVFLALLRGLPRLRDGRALRGWLVATTDRIARATALRTRRELALAEPSPEAAGNVAADAPPVLVSLETLEEKAAIRLALSSMPENCRRLIEALYYEDPKPAYAQLARRWHVPIGSLGPTRARCMDRLRKILRHLLSENSGITKEASSTFEQDDPGNEPIGRGSRPPRALEDGSSHALEES